jgi:hypothetical protein
VAPTEKRLTKVYTVVSDVYNVVVAWTVVPNEMVWVMGLGWPPGLTVQAAPN